MPVQYHALPRTRGDEPARAWRCIRAGTLYPAHAGMNPWAAGEIMQLDTLPRTRGDEPTETLNHMANTMLYPAHAGMNPPFL